LGFSKYPDELDDSITLPPSTDLITPVKAEVVNRLRDAVLAIEMELAAQPSGAYGTVKARLDAMQAQLTTVAQDLDALEAEIGDNPSGAFDTVADRFTSIDSSISSLQSDVAQLIIDVDVIEAELGSNPSGAFSTVVARFTNIDAQIAGLSASSQVVVPIISGFEDTNSSTLISKGACILNPNALGNPAVTFTVEVILQSTDGISDATFELFNITENAVVAHPSIISISDTPEFVSVSLTVGGSDLPGGQNNVLEGRISLESGAASEDRAICKYAAIRVTPS
jgi:hypothetical protein